MVGVIGVERRDSRLRVLLVGLLVLAGCVVWLVDSAGPRAGMPAAKVSPQASQALLSAYGRSGLVFERNDGQVAASVKFFARGQGYALGLTEKGPELVLQRGTPRRSRGTGTAGSGHGLAAAGREAVLGSTFVGGAAAPRLVASARRAGRVNYLIGSRASDWHTGVGTFGQVTYRDVWPGIDVRFHGNQRTLEYDYSLAPGADPGRIGVRFRGVRSIRLDAHGDLVLSVAGGTVRELAPHAYQTIRGGRRTVRSRFVIGRGGVVRMHVGRYDRARGLVIDPTLAYSTYLGGSGYDGAEAVAVDGAGDIFITGQTGSTDFPTTTGATSGAYQGKLDAFVTKLTSSGALAYSTYLGGSNVDGGNGITIDSSGDAYVTGTTSSPDFPISAGAAQANNAGGFDAFVTKLTSSGALAYSTYLGGSGNDGGRGITVNSRGVAYVTGSTASTNFPTTAGAFQSASGGNGDAFITELTASGALGSSTYLAGGGADMGDGIGLDSAGNVYVAGTTSSTDFPTTTGAAQRTLGGDTNAFVTKLASTGAVLYSTYYGQIETQAFGLAVDGAGDAFVVGSENAGDLSETGDDVMTLKLTPAGAVDYASALGSAGNDYGYGIAVDSAGDAFVTGQAAGKDFTVTSDALQRTYAAGGSDAFVAELNPAGGTAYSSYLGGDSGDSGAGIAVGQDGNVVIVGGTESTDFPTTASALQTAQPGDSDAFLTRLVFPPRSTSVTVSCTPNPDTVSTSAGCTATVTDTDAGAPTTPTGTITFTRDGSGVFTGSKTTGSCTLAPKSGSTGVSSCKTYYVPSAPGTATIRGSYPGDSTHAAGTETTKLPVFRVTGTSVACTPAAPAVNQSAACTVTVTDTSPGTVSAPTGTIAFTRSGSGQFPSGTTGTCTLAAGGTKGTASCQITYTPSGTAISTIKAAYPGDTTHQASSQTTKLTATLRTTTTAIVCAPNPIAAKTASTCTATVTDTSPGTKGTPSGTVTFTRAGTGLFTGGLTTGTCTLAATGTAGTASCHTAITPSAAGTDTIRATFPGSSTLATSTQTAKLAITSG